MLGTFVCILTSCGPPKQSEIVPPNNDNIEKPPTTPAPTADENEQVIDEPTTTDEPLVLPPITPNVNNTTPATQTPVTQLEPVPVQNNAPVKSNGSSVTAIYSALQAYATQGQNYYTQNVYAEGLVTRGGKLYNAKGTAINAAYLDNYTNVNSQLENFGCDVLLIKGSDLALYEGAQVPAASNGLSVFTAIKLAGNNKILLSSAAGSAGSITLEDYRKLLKSYNQNHGEIGSPVAGSEEYERILNFIRVHEGIYDSYFVREMKMDEKYAIVTLSSQANTLDIKQYILINDNNFWEVAMSEIETEVRVVTAVNQHLPDFNLSLLPTFNIAASKNNLKADNSAVFKVMVMNNLIESTSQIYYACGTTDYCYIVLYDNSKFLAIRSGPNWKVEQVPSSRVALDLLYEDGGQAAAFILLDNDKAV